MNKATLQILSTVRMYVVYRRWHRPGVQSSTFHCSAFTIFSSMLLFGPRVSKFIKSLLTDILTCVYKAVAFQKGPG